MTQEKAKRAKELLTTINEATQRIDTINYILNNASEHGSIDIDIHYLGVRDLNSSQSTLGLQDFDHKGRALLRAMREVLNDVKANAEKELEVL